MAYLALVASFILNATANLLMRAGAKAGFSFSSYNPFFLIRDNWLTFAGLCIFGLSAVTYFITLRSISLTVAYPVIVIMSFLLTALAGYLYLHEKIYVSEILGYALLCIGLFVIFYFNAKRNGA